MNLCEFFAFLCEIKSNANSGIKTQRFHHEKIPLVDISIKKRQSKKRLPLKKNCKNYAIQ
jgi:hypothetical protein